jgi:hypothetical protein
MDLYSQHFITEGRCMFIDGVKFAELTMRFVLAFLLCAILLVYLGGLCFAAFGVSAEAAPAMLFQMQIAPVLAGVLAASDTMWQVRKLQEAWRARMVRRL